MIAALLRRRREAAAARAEALRASADRFIRFNDGDLDASFWRAHARMTAPDASAAERDLWGAMVDEIDRRRPARPARADAATRALFRRRPQRP